MSDLNLTCKKTKKIFLFKAFTAINSYLSSTTQLIIYSQEIIYDVILQYYNKLYLEGKCTSYTEENVGQVKPPLSASTSIQ